MENLGSYLGYVIIWCVLWEGATVDMARRIWMKVARLAIEIQKDPVKKLMIARKPETLVMDFHSGWQDCKQMPETIGQDEISLLRRIRRDPAKKLMAARKPETLVMDLDFHSGWHVCTQGPDAIGKDGISLGGELNRKKWANDMASKMIVARNNGWPYCIRLPESRSLVEAINVILNSWIQDDCLSVLKLIASQTSEFTPRDLGGLATDAGAFSISGSLLMQKIPVRREAIHIAIIETEEAQCHGKAGMASGYEAKNIAGNSLMDVYFQCGSKGDAYQGGNACHVFRQICVRDAVFWNLIFWNLMLAGTTEHEASRDVVVVLQMQLQTCTQSGNVIGGLGLYWHMQQMGVKLNRGTFVMILSMCSTIAHTNRRKWLHVKIHMESCKNGSTQLQQNCLFQHHVEALIAYVNDAPHMRDDAPIGFSELYGLGGSMLYVCCVFKDHATVGKQQPKQASLTGILNAGLLEDYTHQTLGDPQENRFDRGTLEANASKAQAQVDVTAQHQVVEFVCSICYQVMHREHVIEEHQQFEQVKFDWILKLQAMTVMTWTQDGSKVPLMMHMAGADVAAVFARQDGHSKRLFRMDDFIFGFGFIFGLGILPEIFSACGIDVADNEVTWWAHHSNWMAHCKAQNRPEETKQEKMSFVLYFRMQGREDSNRNMYFEIMHHEVLSSIMQMELYFKMEREELYLKMRGGEDDVAELYFKMQGGADSSRNRHYGIMHHEVDCSIVHVELWFKGSQMILVCFCFMMTRAAVMQEIQVDLKLAAVMQEIQVDLKLVTITEAIGYLAKLAKVKAKVKMRFRKGGSLWHEKKACGLRIIKQGLCARPMSNDKQKVVSLDIECLERIGSSLKSKSSTQALNFKMQGESVGVWFKDLILIQTKLLHHEIAYMNLMHMLRIQPGYGAAGAYEATSKARGATGAYREMNGGATSSYGEKARYGVAPSGNNSSFICAGGAYGNGLGADKYGVTSKARSVWGANCSAGGYPSDGASKYGAGVWGSGPITRQNTEYTRV